MAANDYYHPTPSYQVPAVDFDSPPPPPPASEKPSNRYRTSYSNPFAVSPERSPFDDPSYPPSSYPPTPPEPGRVRRQYSGSHAADRPEQDPFADNLPLRDYPSYPARDPYERKSSSQTGFYPEMDNGGYPANEDPNAGSKKKGRMGRKRFNPLNPRDRTPWFVYIMTLIQVTVFIGELIHNSVLTGSPIAIHPSFNPMIGPSNRVLIEMGARYQPCMRSVHGVQDSAIPPKWPCPNTTTTDETSPEMQCTLSDVCGFHGVPEPVGGGSLDDQPQPNQWFRFIIPMFLHAGIIHISFNMLLQLTLGRDMEKIIGPFRFAIVYISSGIFGFVLGGNFAAAGQSSSGASGCLFGIIALILLDLLYTWRTRKTPFVDLAFIGVDVAVSFVLGLLPGLDNFSHIGGFLMGLGLGVCILHSPNALRQRLEDDVHDGAPHDLPYVPVDHNGNYMRESVDSTAMAKAKANILARKPLGFFKDRKPLWWVWWGIRAAALIGVLVAFIVLLNNFYKYRTTCSWCKYLSCLPVKDWCSIGDLQIITAP